MFCRITRNWLIISSVSVGLEIEFESGVTHQEFFVLCDSTEAETPLGDEDDGHQSYMGVGLSHDAPPTVCVNIFTPSLHPHVNASLTSWFFVGSLVKV